MLNRVDIDPEGGKVFTYKELRKATDGFSFSNKLDGGDCLAKTLMQKETTNGSSSSNMLNRVDIDPEGGKVFTYKELHKATDGFSFSNKLDEGGCLGNLYKGRIAGNLVAVQVLYDGVKSLPNVDILSRVRHRHVVSVLGYCCSGVGDITDGLEFLVYEYVPERTLEKALRGTGAPCMDWATRMNIALGTARGLVNLHYGYHETILHRDLTTSNIYLDEQWESLVGSFGLVSPPAPFDETVYRELWPRPGYGDPEYFKTGKFTVESDVYSFGVVLLELITGKKAYLDWASCARDVFALADPNLNGKYRKGEMLRMYKVAALCISPHSADRPTMAVALQSLQPKEPTLQKGLPRQE